jgi:hypothetical protein
MEAGLKSELIQTQLKGCDNSENIKSTLSKVYTALEG